MSQKFARCYTGLLGCLAVCTAMLTAASAANASSFNFGGGYNKHYDAPNRCPFPGGNCKIVVISARTATAPAVEVVRVNGVSAEPVAW